MVYFIPIVLLVIGAILKGWILPAILLASGFICCMASIKILTEQITVGSAILVNIFVIGWSIVPFFLKSVLLCAYPLVVGLIIPLAKLMVFLSETKFFSRKLF